jgi:hypothetical protein
MVIGSCLCLFPGHSCSLYSSSSAGCLHVSFGHLGHPGIPHLLKIFESLLFWKTNFSRSWNSKTFKALKNYYFKINQTWDIAFWPVNITKAIPFVFNVYMKINNWKIPFPILLSIFNWQISRSSCHANRMCYKLCCCFVPCVTCVKHIHYLYLTSLW